MNLAHEAGLRRFRRRIAFLLATRGVLRWAAIWFFCWGVVVVVGRVTALAHYRWLLAGPLVVFPLACVAALVQWRKQPSFEKARASFDRFNHCGGILMAEEAADTAAWQTRLPRAVAPKLRLRAGRAWGLLAASSAFLALALFLPDRLTRLTTRAPLEIGALVEELQAQVQVLEQEKIIEEQKASDIEKQLAQIKADSSSSDPNKTWEALDHIKEENSALAKQAAEEALNKIAKATELETLAGGLETASADGMDAALVTQGAQSLAGMLRAAQLDEGLMKTSLPPDLLKKLENSLTPEELNKLLEALKTSKGEWNKTVADLSKLKMIDPALLSQIQSASGGGDPAGLAQYLAQFGTNGSGTNNFDMLLAGRGGPGGGGPSAPMTWDNQTTEDGFKPKEEVLPAANHMADSRTVGVSRAAPQLTDDGAVAGSGALAGAKSGGGGAYAQVILPKHKAAVQQFFKREEH